MKFWKSLPKSKQPSSKSYLDVKKACDDPMYTAKLSFFSFFASISQPYLLQYQTDKPMIPFMYDDLISLVRNTLTLIVKPSIISSCQSDLDLKDIKLSSKENILSGKEINVGFAAAALITDWKKKDVINNSDIASFRNGVHTFVTSAIAKIFERCPIGSVVVRNSRVFDPNVMVNSSHEQLQSMIKSLLGHFLKLKLIAANFADNVMIQHNDLLRHELKLYNDKFIGFDKKKDRLDNFFFNVIGIQKYEQLAFVVKVILTLSHGQASVERGFSINKSVLEVNMKAESIVARKLIRDHMIKN